jgi:hypothetical protein
MYCFRSLRLAALPAVLLLSLSAGVRAAAFDISTGAPAVVRFTNNKKAALNDLVLNCIESPQSLLAAFWVQDGRALYTIPSGKGRRTVLAVDVKKLTFRPYTLSLPGNTQPRLPVYSVVITLRNGQKIKTMMQPANLSGNYSGKPPKVGSVLHTNGKPYWAVEYTDAGASRQLVLKDITYKALPSDVEPDPKRK